jgi:hypothetical protein
MKPAEEIENVVKHMSFAARPEMDQRLWADASEAQEQFIKTRPAPSRNWERNTIMKSPITRFTVAAAIIAAVVLGLFEFIGTDTGSGVVWAEVAQQVRACPGVIFRSVSSRSDAKYSMNYLSATKNRKDIYEEGELIISHYLDLETLTAASVFHTQKHYWRDAPLAELNAREHDKMADPKWLVQSIVSCEHRKLGEKMIEGIPCEGLETTDPAVLDESLPASASDVNLRMQLWVSVETNYPVLCEGNVTDTVEGQTHSSAWMMDQFQWNAELDSSLFEPNIPADYEEI